MTIFFSCSSICKSYALRPLFKDVCLSIHEGDQIGLIGPNGAGKSTLLKIIAGLERADSGEVCPKKGLKIGYVPQVSEFDDFSVKETLIRACSNSLDEYEKEYLALEWLDKLKFENGEMSAQKLSGGWKKRLRIAVELIQEPDLLLLDEPTNHLDLEGILWLEKFLQQEAPTYLLISHDRYFLQHTTNRVIEINPIYPKGVFSIVGEYAEFLEQKEQFLAGQVEQERSLASKARKEIDWLRRGPKARTTKAQSRIDNAQEVLSAYAEVKGRNVQKCAQLDFHGSERQTRKLLVAKNLWKRVGERSLFERLDLTLSPGMRLGLVGPNGAGKTTLLRMLAGEISPDMGTLKPADALQVVYFDQHRTQLRDEITLRDALSPRGDYVTFRGHPVHVNGWCKRFLFSPNLLDLPIGRLSGGERARISIAHLMLQTADLLLLDEPTNDLDIQTLETLEESLLEFPGALVLITHDRCMMDRVCNGVLALGSSPEGAMFADFTQWQQMQAKQIQSKEAMQQPSAPVTAKNKTGLTYHEKKELDGIEAKIEKQEADIVQWHKMLESAEVSNDPQKLTEIGTSIALAETKIEELYLRWNELSTKQSADRTNAQ